MGGPVNEASTEYLDTHRDMMPMMKAAPPMKTTMVSGIQDSRPVDASSHRRIRCRAICREEVIYVYI